jgi:hypothetical protein
MAQFSKRHYQAIAQVMQDSRIEQEQFGLHDSKQQSAVNDAMEVVCDELADMFFDDNPLFKRDLFMQACQPGANVRARKVA